LKKVIRERKEEIALEEDFPEEAKDEETTGASKQSIVEFCKVVKI
jgi:hypothetical protein